MKRASKKIVTAVCMVMMLLLVFPHLAFAYTLKANNPYSEKLYLAIIDFDDDYGNWRCHGWWTVQPKSSKTINITSSTAMNHIYIYAHTDNASWGGEGYASSIKRTVISNKFSYHDGEPCPPGRNGRQVYFMKNELYDGYLEWQP